jgi:hypothetical protein
MKEICDKMLEERILSLRAHYRKHIPTLLDQMAADPEKRPDVEKCRVMVTYLIMHWSKEVVVTGILDLVEDDAPEIVEEFRNGKEPWPIFPDA